MATEPFPPTSAEGVNMVVSHVGCTLCDAFVILGPSDAPGGWLMDIYHEARCPFEEAG